MSKRLHSSSSGNSSHYKDMLSEYCCMHVGCNCAPDPAVYVGAGALQRQQRLHESRADLHVSCPRDCARCLATFGFSALFTYVHAAILKSSLPLKESVQMIYDDCQVLLQRGVRSASRSLPATAGAVDDGRSALASAPSTESLSLSRSRRSSLGSTSSDVAFGEGALASGDAAGVAPARGSRDVVQLNMEASRMKQASSLVVDCIKHVLDSMPKTSHVRGTILRQMCAHARVLYPERWASMLSLGIGYKPQSLHNSLQRRASDQPLLKRATFDAAKRDCLGSSVEESIREFWYSQTRQTQFRDKNGKRKEIFYHDATAEEVWYAYQLIEVNRATPNNDLSAIDVVEAYRRLQSDRVEGAVGRATFLGRKPSNVMYGRIREFRCKICVAGWETKNRLESLKAELVTLADDAEQRSAVKATIDELEPAVIAFDEHFRFQLSQRELFKKHIASLEANEVVLLFDFSPYSQGYYRQRSMSDAFCGVQCLHLAVYGLVEGDKFQPRYFDFFTEMKNDGACFRSIMMSFFGMEAMRGKYARSFWSDGGPKHFKTRNSILFMIIEVPNALKWRNAPEWHFFCPSHGKSACDGRAATVKGFLKRLAVKGAKVSGVKGIADAIQSNFDAKLTQRSAFVVQGPVSHLADGSESSGESDDESDVESDGESGANDDVDVINGGERRNWTVLHGVRSFFAWKWARGDENAGYIDDDGITPRFKIHVCRNASAVAPIWEAQIVSPFHSIVFAYTEKVKPKSERFVSVKDPVFDDEHRITVGCRVCVRYDVTDDEDLDPWFPGTIRRIRKVQTSRKIGDEQFKTQFVVDFDGDDPGEKGVLVDADDGVRRIKS